MDTENEIIRRIQKGDRKAYEIIVRQYRMPLFNLALRMTGSYDDADDLAQDAFVAAYQSLNRFDAQKRFFPWIYTIALNHIRNHLKKKQRQYGETCVDENSVPADIPTPEQAAIRHQASAQLERFLQRLPAEMREAVILRYYQGLSFDNISEILNISQSAAKMRVYRGVNRLKELMEAES